MKLRFKVNLKDSKIPEQIKVPKGLKGFMGFFDEEFHAQTKPNKGKLGNFIEKKYLKKIYSFEFDKKNKILKSVLREDFINLDFSVCLFRKKKQYLKIIF